MTDGLRLRQTVLDCADARALAEFYRELLGLVYRPGDEPPPVGQPDPNGADWLVLRNPAGDGQLAFQQIAASPRPTWPDGPLPQMMHLDMSVPNAAELAVQYTRALDLGATVLYDRSADAEEPLWVFADPAGHPFCVFVSAG